MRRKVLLGLGLAGVLSGSAAVAQFASNGAPPTPPAPTGFASGQPVGTLPPAPPVLPPTTPAPTPPTGGYVPPVGGFNPAPAPGAGFQPAAPPAAGQPAASQPVTPTPANAEMSALGPNHPWIVRPEHGAYFITVKSYSRPHRPDPNDPGLTARELAEAMASDIRETHRVQALLFEYISEEKKTEMAAAAAARQRAAAFLSSVENYRQKSQLQGMEFLEPDTRLRYKTFNYRDQIAVLIGGFKSEDEAVKALPKIKAWPAPKNDRLMDGAVIATPGRDGKPVMEKTFLNPYPLAMVVPNPAIPRTAAPAQTGLDPFVVKLNEGRPYSLLKATKTWTLGVKSFSAPVVIQSKDGNTGVMQKTGSSSGADALAAGAEQAESFAKALREMKGPGGQPLGLEAFVLHTRYASLVTVGQFDGPNDPALIEARRVLSSITFNVAQDQRGTKMVGTGQKLFGEEGNQHSIVPMPVPRP